MNSVSIIIPHYRRMKELEALLASIDGQDYPHTAYEVIVVADDADESQLDAISSAFSFAHYVHVKQHAGAACAKNIGAAKAQYGLLVFLDDDAVLTPTWLSSMVSAAMAQPHSDCFQSKVLSKKNKQTLLSSGGVANIYGYAWDRGAYQEDRGQYDADTAILYASSCAMMVRKEAFERVKGFDEDIFFMGEDHDFGLRIRLSGGCVQYVPTAVAYHAEKSKENEDVVRYYLERNRLYVVCKNYELWLLLIILVPLLVVKCGKYISYLFRFRRKKLIYAQTVLRGWAWMFAHGALMVQRRRETMPMHQENIMTVFRKFPAYIHDIRSVKGPEDE